jgi:hypothetical protein
MQGYSFYDINLRFYIPSGIQSPLILRVFIRFKRLNNISRDRKYTGKAKI